MGTPRLTHLRGLKMRLSSRASEERAIFDDNDLQMIFAPERFNLEKLRKPFFY